MNRQIICKTANKLTQEGNKQSASWKMAWKLNRIATYMITHGAQESTAWETALKLYTTGWTVKLEGTDWTASQVGLRNTSGTSYLTVVNCKGRGHTYRKLQIRSHNQNVGFVPAKFAEIFKKSDTIPFITTKLFTKEIDGKFEAKVIFKIAERNYENLENAI